MNVESPATFTVAVCNVCNSVLSDGNIETIFASLFYVFNSSSVLVNSVSKAVKMSNEIHALTLPYVLRFNYCTSERLTNRDVPFVLFCFVLNQLPEFP